MGAATMQHEIITGFGPLVKRNMAKTDNGGTMDDIVFKISIWPFAMVTTSLLAMSLTTCFLTAFFFHFEDVNPVTPCGVTNYIPTVSAVIGITPQAYLWRTSIAMQSAPACAISFVYHNHFMSRIHLIPAHRVSAFKSLVRLNFWVHFGEVCSLVMVSYISNRENYRIFFLIHTCVKTFLSSAVHEKLFIVFLVTMLSYMVTNTILFKWTRNKVMSDRERWSYLIKRTTVFCSFSATFGLIFFYIQDEFYCIEGAFNKFAVCEYIVSFSGLCFVYTCYYDFKEKWFVWGTFFPEASSTNNSLHPSSVTNSRIKAKLQ